MANAQPVARARHDEGLAVEGDNEADFTETHQVLLRTARAKGEHVADLLVANNVITNPQAFHDDPSFSAASGVRMGTQEMTRYGMKADDFRALAALIAEIVRKSEDEADDFRREAVTSFRAGFTEMQYCLG